MPSFEYGRRLSAVRSAMKKASVDAFLVTDALNVSYFSGFRGSDAVALITKRDAHLLVDSRYIEEA